jgi:biofilm PGA synthesis lipoprotein PgaB
LTQRSPRRAAVSAAALVSLLILPVAGCHTLHRLLPGRGGVARTIGASAGGGPAPAAPTGPYDPTSFALMSPGAQAARIPVIMYHDVMIERGSESRDVNATKAEFEDGIAFLQGQGASFLTLEQLHRHLTRGEAVPPNSVVLTFDDNYQGFYDNAYPLLREKHIPAAMFVHTNYVGVTKGKHPKMTWETLRALDKEGLITICSHTLSHPPDLTKLPEDEQQRELFESKATLERELGHPIPFFAYPVGKEDATTLDIAQRAGYTMAFTMHNGPVEESPGILTLNRYNYTGLEKAWAACQAAATNAPAAVVDMAPTASPVELHVARFAGTQLGMVTGGVPTTWRSGATARQSVGEFIQEAVSKGTTAVAGMNGTFFANSNLRGNDNEMIGPCKSFIDPAFYPETSPFRLPKLLNRPLVMIGPTRLAIIPFNPLTMNDEPSLRSYMPDLTDVFLAGAWIVHDGKPRNKEEMGAYSARDFNDPRRRAFFGIDAKGEVVLGGSLEVITTEQLARAAAAAGVREALLLDSGFSTSIVYDGKIIVTGHTAKDLPSRPVPQAILVSGTLSAPVDPDTAAAFQSADPSVGAVSASEAQAEAPPGGGPAGTGHRRRRHRR